MLNLYLIILFTIQIIVIFLLFLNISRLNHENESLLATLDTSVKKLSLADNILTVEMDKIVEIQSVTTTCLVLEGLVIVGFIILYIFFGGKGGNDGGNNFGGNTNPSIRFENIPPLKSFCNDDFFFKSHPLFLKLIFFLFLLLIVGFLYLNLFEYNLVV